jgi:hypothetical protein
MQRQLAAFTDDPSFLAHASWPDHACLVSLQLCIQPQAAISVRDVIQKALLTSSVTELTIRIALITDPADLLALTRLTNLTSLTLLAGTPSSSDPVVLAIGQLPSLLQLKVVFVGDWEVLDAPLGEAAFPPSWQQLTRLTSFRMAANRPRGVPALQLCQLCALPACSSLCWAGQPGGSWLTWRLSAG